MRDLCALLFLNGSYISHVFELAVQLSCCQVNNVVRMVVLVNVTIPC